jgi:hypothetical protein
MKRWVFVMAICVVLAACGLSVQEGDLFLLTRTGGGQTLTILVDYGGTISCNGGPPQMLPDQLLLVARDLQDSLNPDAKNNLHIPPPPDSVYTYKVKLPDGTITFPDTAGAQHSELAQTEQFVLQAAATPCGISH